MRHHFAMRATPAKKSTKCQFRITTSLGGNNDRTSSGITRRTVSGTAHARCFRVPDNSVVGATVHSEKAAFSSLVE